MNKQRLKRRANILYRLRKKGIRADTKQRIVFCAAGKDITNIVQVKRLKQEFHFNIQIVIQ
jgi:hypothetical protein